MAGLTPDVSQKLAAAIIGYFPLEAVQTRMQLLQAAGFYTYYWENSPAIHNATIIADRLLNLKVGNSGLGTALSCLLDTARADGFDYLLYFDQDTEFDESSLAFIRDFVTQGKFPAGFAAIRFAEETTGSSGWVEKKLIFSSGSLFRLQTQARHDARFFVEGVDYQFCLDAAIHAELLGEMPCPGLQHESIQPVHQFHLAGSSWSYRPYPARRHLKFMLALWKLLWRALWYARPDYAWIFMRNIVTHLVTQLQYGLIITLNRLGFVKKAVYL